MNYRAYLVVQETYKERKQRVFNLRDVIATYAWKTVLVLTKLYFVEN